MTKPYTPTDAETVIILALGNGLVQEVLHNISITLPEEARLYAIAFLAGTLAGVADKMMTIEPHEEVFEQARVGGYLGTHILQADKETMQ